MSLIRTMRWPDRLIALLTVAAVSAAAFWSLSSLSHGLFWDDMNVFLAMRDLEMHPFQPRYWGEILSHHPPTAFLLDLVLWNLFGSYFYIAAHIVQAVILIAGAVLIFHVATSRIGLIPGCAILGIFLSWPIVASSSQEIAPDLTVGVLGFAAIIDSADRRYVRSIAWLAVAGLLQFAATGFLVGALALLWRARQATVRRVIAYVFAATIPADWIAISWLRGGPSRVFTLVENQGPATFAYVEVVAGARHFLELFIYDSHWLVFIGAIALLIWRSRANQRIAGGLRDTPLDEGMLFAAIGVFLVVVVMGGSDSLERYLVPIYTPLSWSVARLLMGKGDKYGAYVVALLISGDLITCFMPALLTLPDSVIGARSIALTKSVDANPSWLASFVTSRKRMIGNVASKSGTIGAPWPISDYMLQPAAGFTTSPLHVREWYPGDDSCGLSLVWIDSSRTAHFEDWRRDVEVIAQENGRWPAVVAFPKPSTGCRN